MANDAKINIENLLNDRVGREFDLNETKSCCF
jgi:hypothetical protein